MNIFNGYLEGYERNLAIESAKLENEYTKLTTLFEMTQLQVEQMHRDAEMKVFEEAGTYDDLTYLYQEADAEVNGQRKNILQKIIAWFAKIFSKIGNGIKNFFKMGDDDTEVEAPADIVEKVGAIEKCWNNMQNGLAKLRNGDLSGALDLLKVIGLPVAIAVGAGVTYRKYKKGELNALMKKLEGIKDKAQSIFDSIKGKFTSLTNSDEQNKAHGVLKLLQKFITWISTAVSTITGFVTGAIKGITTSSSDPNEGTVNDNGITYVFDRTTGKVKSATDDKTGKPTEYHYSSRVEGKIWNAMQKAQNGGSKEAKPANKKAQKKVSKSNEGKVNDNGITYVFDLATGKVKTAIDDKTGKPKEYHYSSRVEGKIWNAMQKAQKGATSTESADGGFVLTTEAEAILRKTFGENAIFAIEGTNLFVFNAKDIFEEEISVSESVFGVYAGDLVEESVDDMDAFDKEMQDLLDDFRNL